MGESLVLRGVAAVGFLTALSAGSVYVHRHVPRVYPQERTRLDERTYRAVRGALAPGLVLGSVGAVLSLIDTVGTVRALEASQTGLLAAMAILVPVWLGPTMVKAGVALLVGAAILAGVAEVRNARG